MLRGAGDREFFGRLGAEDPVFVADSIAEALPHQRRRRFVGGGDSHLSPAESLSPMSPFDRRISEFLLIKFCVYPAAAFYI